MLTCVCILSISYMYLFFFIFILIFIIIDVAAFIFATSSTVIIVLLFVCTILFIIKAAILSLHTGIFFYQTLISISFVIFLFNVIINILGILRFVVVYFTLSCMLYFRLHFSFFCYYFYFTMMMMMIMIMMMAINTIFLILLISVKNCVAMVFHLFHFITLLTVCWLIINSNIVIVLLCRAVTLYIFLLYI